MDAMAPRVLLYKFHRILRAWLARFTFNGITRYDQGAYDLVGGVAEGFCAAVELSDAEREELRWLRNRTIQQRTADVFMQNWASPDSVDRSLRVLP